MIKKVLLFVQMQLKATCKKKELFWITVGIEIFYLIELQVLSFLA
jgi:hypothetical protein